MDKKICNLILLVEQIYHLCEIIWTQVKWNFEVKNPKYAMIIYLLLILIKCFLSINEFNQIYKLMWNVVINNLSNSLFYFIICMDLPFLLLSQENKKLQRHLKPTILSSVYMGYEEEIMPYLGKIQHYPHWKKLKFISNAEILSKLPN